MTSAQIRGEQEVSVRDMHVGSLPTQWPDSASATTGRSCALSSILSGYLRLTIGVDPGILGALVVLGDGEPLQFTDMPTMPRKTRGNEVDARRLVGIVRGILQASSGAHVMAVLEPPSTRPGESPTAGQHSGEGYGVLKGVFAALCVPWVEVRPQLWKRHFGLLGTVKDVARQYAMQRFPRHAQHMSRKKDNGRGDAALIALWAWETEQHAELTL